MIDMDGRSTTMYFYRVGSLDPHSYNTIHWVICGFAESKEEAKDILYNSFSVRDLRNKKVMLMSFDAHEVLDEDVEHGGLYRDLRDVVNQEERIKERVDAMRMESKSRIFKKW